MDIDRISKVISYISSINKADEVSSADIEKISLKNDIVENVDGYDNKPAAVKENYGAERYLICNPNVLYRYVNRNFITKNSFKVNKAAYAEAAKKYGHKNIMKKSCFEESYI